MTMAKHKITNICKKIIIFLFDTSESQVILILKMHCKDLKFHGFKIQTSKKKKVRCEFIQSPPKDHGGCNIRAPLARLYQKRRMLLLVPYRELKIVSYNNYLRRLVQST